MRLFCIVDGGRVYKKFCISIVIILLLNQFLLSITAESKKFDYKEFNETITIQNNDYTTIDFIFIEGEKLEIIFLLQSKEELPIDVWFVNKDNFLLLTNGAQFLFYIDGTEQKISYAKKIVTLEEHNDYKMVITNYYANKTVEVELKGEIRTFGIESEPVQNNEKSLFEQYYLISVLLIIIVILVIVLVVFTIKSNRYKQKINNINGDPSSKKSINNKSRQKKKIGPSTNSPKKKKNKKSNKKKSSLTKKNKDNSTNFCGFCGEPSNTPYCKKCGHEI